MKRQRELFGEAESFCSDHQAPSQQRQGEGKDFKTQVEALIDFYRDRRPKALKHQRGEW